MQSTIEEWKPHLTVATIVHRNGRFLMVEELADGQHVLNQPAGHLEDGETLPTAAARETLEETGWTVEPQTVTGVYHWRQPESGETFVRICFGARCVSHDAARRLDDGILQALWLTRAELAASHARHRSPMVMRCLDDFMAGHRYPIELLAHL